MMTPTGPECLRAQRILVVEDEFLIASFLETFLRGMGCKVIGPVPTIDRALELLDQDVPDAVLLDGNLRGQLSRPVAERLIAVGVPFVVITGYVDLVAQDAVLATAPQVQKPFQASNLLQRMVENFC
jgi:DNA-binding response OmpR family regulator